ncbi:MAG: hypothetical protein ACJZ4Z_01685 [Candidatus Thalassarchaeaceae archaeon]
MTINTSTDEEYNWFKFHTCYRYFRSNRKDGSDEYLKEWLADLDKIKSKKNKLDCFLEKEFDFENYFKLIFCLRLLNTRECVKEDYKIPNIVSEYLNWWNEIGSGTDTKSVNMDGMGNIFIQNPKVPNWIKIHIISNFIMRRNLAIQEKLNFEVNPNAVNDVRQAIGYAERFLKIIKRDGGKSIENGFMGANSIESLFMIEKLLFSVRTERYVEDVIFESTHVLGHSLNTKNRVLSIFYSFWCYHVLWRCFICIGDTQTANIFKENSEELRKKFESIYGFEFAGPGFEGYTNSLAKKHYDCIKVIVEGDFPSYATRSDNNEKKLDDLFRSRDDFYENFIGHSDNRYWHPNNPKGRKSDLFSKQQTNKDWESRIEQIPKLLKSVSKYLEKSTTMVSIPTLRLLIIDLLLIFSRVIVSFNPDERNPTKWIDEKSAENIDTVWEEKVKPNLSIMKKNISKIRENISIYIDGNKLYDFDKIIGDIDRILKGESNKLEFNIINKGRKIRKISSRKAGKNLQELLKELIIGSEKYQSIELQFPLLKSRKKNQHDLN